MIERRLVGHQHPQGIVPSPVMYPYGQLHNTLGSDLCRAMFLLLRMTSMNDFGMQIDDISSNMWCVSGPVFLLSLNGPLFSPRHRQKSRRQDMVVFKNTLYICLQKFIQLQISVANIHLHPSSIPIPLQPDFTLNQTSSPNQAELYWVGLVTHLP